MNLFKFQLKNRQGERVNPFALSIQLCIQFWGCKGYIPRVSQSLIQKNVLKLKIGLFAVLLALVIPAAFGADESSQFSYEVKIKAKKQFYNGVLNVVQSTGGVVITSQNASLYADEVNYSIDENTAYATGNVRLTDPVGEVICGSLIYNFRTQKGKADGIIARSTGSRISAEKIDIYEGSWKIYKVAATTCECYPPVYEIFASSIIVKPGKELICNNVQLSLFGNKIFWLPWGRISLKAHERALPIPIIGYDDSKGFSLRTEQTFPIGKGVWFGFWDVFHTKEYPESRIVFAKSLLGNEYPLSTGINETGDKFSLGFLDDTAISSVSDEEAALKRHSVVFAELSSNIPLTGRSKGDTTFSKHYEIGYYDSRKIGDISGSISARIGEVKEMPSNISIKRATSEAHLSSPEFLIKDDFSWRLKNAMGFTLYENQKSYYWLRPQVEMYWRPSDRFAFGLGYSRTYTQGAAFLELDNVQVREAVNTRIDTRIGNTKITGLMIYDIGNDEIYDLQLRIGQFMQCIEPTLIWKKNLSEFTIGINLMNWDTLLDVFSKRKKELEKPK